MDFKSLEKFIKIAKECGAVNLKYEEDDHKFSISFPGGEIQTGIQPPHPAIKEVGPSAASLAVIPQESGLKEIKSPFVGTFYRSPSPESPLYVNQGDKIAKGQVVCIIEAMKIMNEIEAEISGEIVEICVENETYVEFNQTLYKVKP